MTALVIEHDAETLFFEPARDREPDLVAAAPTVGEDHHRRLRTFAPEIPDGQLRPVRCPNDGMVGPFDALAPPESEA